MYILFDPRTQRPTGATPAKPQDDYYIEIDKNEWTKFLLNPSLFSQYEAVLQSDGTYNLCKIVDKSFSLKDRFFEVQIEDEPLLDFDVRLYIKKNKALLVLSEDIQKHFSSMTFFLCKESDPDKLYDTLVFVGGIREVQTDILERLDDKYLSVFGSFKYHELTYGCKVDA